MGNKRGEKKRKRFARLDGIKYKLKKILIKPKIRITVGQVIALLISLALFAYPVVEEMLTQHESDQLITSYTQHVQNNTEQNALLLAQAQAYNARLSNTEDESGYKGTIPPEYELIAGLDMPFAWVEFPQLSQRIPVYHGTSYEALQAGVGHLSGTSIPVGGESTHAVLTGHSGMRGSRMFDDIDQLEIGEIFLIHVLDQTLAYKVYDTEVVLPYETDSLKIQKGRDLCSLITCYPYGVNTHRYIVHAERTPYDPSKTLPDDTGAIFNQRTYPLWFAILVLITFLFFWWFLRPKEIGHNAKGVKRLNRHDKLPQLPIQPEAIWVSMYEPDFMEIRQDSIDKENKKQYFKSFYAWLKKATGERDKNEPETLDEKTFISLLVLPDKTAEILDETLDEGRAFWQAEKSVREAERAEMEELDELERFLNREHTEDDEEEDDIDRFLSELDEQ